MKKSTKSQQLRPGKTPKFRSTEEQIKYFTRLEKQQKEKVKKEKGRG